MRSLSVIIAAITIFACVTSVLSQDKADEGSYKLHDDHRHARFRRNLIQFYKMLDCATTNEPLRYNLYGCYCGFGGKGTPVDDLDRCCQTHDVCYSRIKSEKLCRLPLSVYARIYHREGCTGCASSNDKCQLAICECDSAAARCFAKYKINPMYERYPQRKCD